MDVVLIALEESDWQITFILKKARFFDRFRHLLNARQLKVIRRMLEEGPRGFEGGMTARKYVAIAITSKATATRDLQDLALRSNLKHIGGGQSTRYELGLGHLD